MRPISLSPQAFAKASEEYQSAGCGRKRGVLEKWAERAGCHPGSLRNAIQRGHIVKPNRYEFGEEKKELLTTMSTFLESRILSKQNRSLPISAAIRAAEDFTIIPRGAVKPRELCRFLRRYRLVPQHRVTGRFRRGEAGAMHQVDFSCSRALAYAGEGRVQVRSNFTIPYENRLDDGKKKVWIGSVVDDASGVVYAQYFLSKGEDTALAITFLERAWQRKPDYPFWGVPHESVYTDRVGWGKTKEIQNLFGKLRIRLIVPPRGEMPWTKGKVERKFRDIKEEFEQFLIGQLARGTMLSLVQANEMLAKFCMKLNLRPHPSGKGTRLDYWLNHVPDLWFPDNFRELAYKQHLATVRRGLIQYERKLYYAPPEIPDGERVEVIVLEGRLFIYLPKTKLAPARRLLLQEAGLNVAPPVDAEAEAIRERSEQIHIPPASVSEVEGVLASYIPDSVDLTPPPPTRHTKVQGPGVELLHEDAQRRLLADVLQRALGSLPQELREELIDPFVASPHSKSEVKRQAELILQAIARPAQSEIEERLRSGNE